LIGRRAAQKQQKGRILRVCPFLILGLLGMNAAQATASPTPPYDVARFLDRRMNCDHWAGEEPYDADRRREIDAAIRHLRCDAIARDERRIRKRYASRPAVLELLDSAQ
jgi:hypothetical protein